MTRSTDLADPAGPRAEPRTPPDHDPRQAALSPHPGRSMPWPPTEHQRGLAAPYPPGGLDPDPDSGRREERYYLRLLVAMVLLIVVGGFVVSLVGILLGFAGSAG